MIIMFFSKKILFAIPGKIHRGILKRQRWVRAGGNLAEDGPGKKCRH
jgi:hypothetical protein